MKANFYKCVVIFCALLTTLTITVHVTPTIALTETDSYETFVAAINSAENGDTVRLTNNINVSQPIFVIDKNITICLDGSVKAKSADDVAAVFNIKGGEVTIKSSSGATVKGTKTLFDVNDGANVSLDGIKMEKTSSNGSNYGVRAASGSTVEITNCSVEYHGYVNAPDTSFYGIYADSATISVKNTSFVLTQSIDGYVSEMYGIFGNVSSILRLSGINIIVAQSECAKKSKAYGVCSEGSGEISESQVLTYSAYTAKAISGGSEFSVISGKYAADGKNKSAVSGVSVKSGSFNTDPSAFVVGGGVVRTDGTESYDYEYESANLAALDRVLRYVVEGAAEPCAHEKMTEVVVVEASCEQNGLLRRVCDNCNFYEEKEISALGHNCIVTDTKEPTCTADGYATYKCSRCEYGYTEKQNMLGHNCIVTDTKEPTCTADGYTTYKCSRCEYGYTEKRDKLGHEIVHHEGKTPTCLEVGYEAYDTCSRCDYNTYKELGKVDHNYVLSLKTEPTCISDGKEEYECTYCLDKYEVTLPMLGHDCAVEDTKEPTCTEDGYTAYKCSRCEYGYTEKQNMLGHDCTVTDTKEPTCTADGYTTYKCSRCEYGYTDTLGKLGHEIVHHEGKTPTCLEVGYEAYDTCSRCDYSTFMELGRLSHEYSSDWTVDLDATCSREGKKSRHCLYCSATTEETAIPKTAHREKRTLLKEATCDNDGVAQYECLDCGEKREEALPMSGHSYIETSRSNPSCETSGKIVYVCEKCGKNSVTVIPDLGHKFGTLIEELAPTCSLYGQKAHYKCQRCGEYFDEYKNDITEEDIIIDKKPHEYSSPKVIKKSTCQEKGELLYTCLRCGSQYTETTEKSPHVLRFVTGKAATCIEDGFADYEECLVCDYSTMSVIEKYGHDYCPDWIVSDYPTCESVGSKTHVCRRCGQNDGMVIMEKLGHDFVKFEDVQPTCENSGERGHRECRRCGKVEKEILPAIGHRYEQVSKTQPTCISDGFIVYECANCGRTKEEALFMLGHELEFFDVLMPSCTQKGHNAYEKCVRCDYTTYKEYAQLGHDMIFVEGKTATCEIGGYCDYEKCLRCGFSTIKEIPALGHKYDNEYTVDKQPSCDEKGERSRHCLTCGNRIDVTSIPMKPHDFVKTVLSERSCETDYEAIFECKVCGIKEKTFEPMYGHDCIFVGEKQPTCTEDGYEEYSCSRCEYGYRDVLSKLGHDIIHHGGKLPSCEAKGWNEYETCSRCDYSTYSEIEAKGHRRLSAVVENRREPTCTSDGSFDHVEYCGECQKELSREKEILSKLGHNVSKIGEKQPTCTEDGYEEYSCSRCEYTKKATLTKLGHDIIHHGGKLPSCEAKGWNEYETCSRCDYSTYSEIEAKGHRRLSAVVENRREPTCTSDGCFDRVEYCGECQKELSREKEILSKLGHNVGKIGEKQPTCTEDGYEEYSCSRCEYGYRETVFSDGHRFSDWKIEEGNHAKLCVKCGFKQSYTHEYGESETTKEPTLSDGGEQLRECKVCGYRFIQKLSKINVTATCDGECIDGAITASYDKETDEVTVTATEMDNKKFKGWYDGDICVCQEKTYTFARNSVGVKALYEDDKGETILLLVAAFFVALASAATVVGFRYKKRKK